MEMLNFEQAQSGDLRHTTLPLPFCGFADLLQVIFPVNSKFRRKKKKIIRIKYVRGF